MGLYSWIRSCCMAGEFAEVDMMFVGIYIALLVIVIVIAFWGGKSGKLQYLVKTCPKIPKVLTLGYIIFAGCFVFPIRSELFPFDFQRLYTLVGNYGVIVLALAGTFGSGRERVVYLVTFLFTAVGMGCRYLLEFGEVSNTYNFTLFNIISYLAMIPACTVIVYHWIARSLNRR